MPSEDREQDREKLWRRWQASGDRRDFESTLESLRPMVESEVNRYKTVSAPPSALRAEAFHLTANALRSFDPAKNVQLSTWVGQHLRKMSRYAQRFQSAGSIPEARRLRIATYQRVRDELSEKHGREPSAQELADVLAWPLSEVARMRRELRGEILDTADPVLQELGRDEGPVMSDNYKYRLATIRTPVSSDRWHISLTPWKSWRLDGHRRTGKETDGTSTGRRHVGRGRGEGGHGREDGT